MADLVWALFGARGSGKSTEAKTLLKKRPPSRLVVWDFMDEYGDHGEPVASLAALAEATRAARFALRYVPPRGTDAELTARFRAFCAIVYERQRLLMLVEELQRVTRPGAAPAEWSDCTLRGRHRDISIIGISQRPAHVDKDLFSNATMVRTGRLNFADDVHCMAGVLDVPVAAVRALHGHDFIARDMLTGRVTGQAATPAGASQRPPQTQKKAARR